MNKREAKLKYLHRYIGMKSPEDGAKIKDIQELNRMLKEDGYYVILRKIWFGWAKQPEKKWFIAKVYKNAHSLSYDRKLADRVYAINEPMIIH